MIVHKETATDLVASRYEGCLSRNPESERTGAELAWYGMSWNCIVSSRTRSHSLSMSFGSPPTVAVFELLLLCSIL